MVHWSCLNRVSMASVSYDISVRVQASKGRSYALELYKSGVFEKLPRLVRHLLEATLIRKLCYKDGYALLHGDFYFISFFFFLSIHVY